MSLKKRIFNFFAALVLMFGSTPFIFKDASAATGLSAPEAHKTRVDNGDGTYTISLSVEGKAKTETTSTGANVVVVFDTSGSMDYATGTNAYEERTHGRYGLLNDEYIQLYYYSSFWRDYVEVRNNDNHDTVYYYDETAEEYVQYTDDTGTNPGIRYNQVSQNRLDVAKSALNSLATKLLANNTEETPNAIEIAFIDFSTTVNDTTEKMTSLSQAKAWINERTAGGGTNWESALTAANNFSFGDTDKTYVIFVSDGDPTFRDSKNGYNDYNQRYRVYGDGQSDPNSRNFNAAKTVAGAIVENTNKELFSVGVFGSVTNMQNLGGTYKDATDQAALNAAFDDIVNKITNSLRLEDVAFSDGITGETTIAAGVAGVASSFKYEIKRSGESDFVEYTPAKEAKFEDGKVTWDAGDINDGDVVKVSFVVWASQAAYDEVADNGNNGTGLTSGIEKDGDSYKLRTNEADPTLTYKVKTCTSQNGGSETCTTSDTQTATLENLEAVELIDTKMSVSKLWLDGIDASQRDGYSKVSLDFYKGSDEKIKTFEISKADSATWTTDETVYVAPGLMTTNEDLKDYGTEVEDEEGNKYYVLEAGHDYHFANETFYDKNGNVVNDAHFELTKYEYHPMLLNGDIYDVTFSEDGKTIEKMTKISDAGIIAENTMKGGASIKKVVVNQDGEEIKESDATFEITAHFKESYDYDYRIYYGKNNPCHDARCEGQSDDDFAKYRSGHIYGTGDSFSETIYAGDEIRIVNMPLDTEFYVEESEEMPTGYSQQGDVEYKISKGTSGEGSSFTDEDKDGNYYIVRGNSVISATVTNVYKTSKLTIKKTVEGDGSKTDKFNFNVKLYPSANETSDDDLISETTVEVEAGKEKEVTELPIGAYYVVEEDDYSDAGFTTTSTGETGTILEDGTAKAEFANIYSAEATEVQFDVRKKFAFDFDLGLANPMFTFKLEADNDNARRVLTGEKTITMTDFTTTKAFEKINLDKVGEYKFKISEVNGGLAGYSYDETIYTATVTVEDNGFGELVVMDVTSVEKEDEKYIVEFTNSYEAKGSLTINVEKILEGRDWIDSDNFVLTINDEENNKEEKEVSSEERTAVFTFEYVYNSEKDDTGRHVYTISEKTDGLSQKGIEKETEDIEIIVNVTDNGRGELEVSYENAAVTEIEKQIKNVYSTKPTSEEDFVITFNKEIVDESEDQTAEDTSFSFTIEGLSEGFEDYSETIELTTEDLFGSGAFTGISFSEAGEYKFKVSEVNDEKEYFEYDQTEYYITVIVADDYEDAQLYIESVIISETEDYDEEAAEIDEIAFVNYYNESGRGGVEEPIENEENPYTRDNISSLISLWIISLVGLVGTIVLVKRNA